MYHYMYNIAVNNYNTFMSGQRRDKNMWFYTNVVLMKTVV